MRPQGKAARWWLPTALLAVLGMQTMMVASLADLRSALQDHEERKMATLETTWTDATGLTHTVTTQQAEGETDAQHAARHHDAVEALKALYPPV